MNDTPSLAEMNNVMHHPDLSPGARLLWLELVYSWVGNGIDVCFPHQPDLAERLNVSRSSIGRWFQELIDAGFLGVKRLQRGNEYALLRNPDVSEQCSTEDKHVNESRNAIE